ncbi:phycobilisome linker polypeptide [Alkalinema pantanalense CENA528]|uniref:phycobilisome linker polypeptide n=1 Tax=Alkalinema pantanalense TaxID=1620705 RepID=UPI003D6FA88C
MLGQSVLTRASGSTSNNRTFVYEVEGLRQSDQTTQNNHEIRTSSTTLIQVPFNRMNEVMQRVNRLGGRIVAIHAGPNVTASSGEGSQGES